MIFLIFNPHRHSSAGRFPWGTDVVATDYIEPVLIHSPLPVHQDTQIAPGPEGAGSQLDYVLNCPTGYRRPEARFGWHRHEFDTQCHYNC